jgi:hypothetical protein
MFVAVESDIAGTFCDRCVMRLDVLWLIRYVWRIFNDLRKDEEQDTHEDGGGGGAHGYLRTLHCPHLHINK